MQKRIEFIFWTLFLILGFAFHSQLLAWPKALFRTVGIVLLFAVVAYANIKFLIPNFLNRKGYIWYILNILAILFIVPYLFSHTNFLFSFDFRIEFHSVHQQESELLISRTPEQFKFVFMFLVTAFIIALSIAYRVTLDYIEKQQQKLEMEKLKLQAELSLLRTQMNPHFFLNAINGLYALSRLSPQKTGEYITKLGEMLRYLTYECSKNNVLLSQEIDYIKNFIYFQKTRDETVSVTWEEEIENAQFKIEPMILMPFVENAFKHSYCESGETAAVVKIKIKQEKSSFRFLCENTVPDHPAESVRRQSGGLGIKNVEERLRVVCRNNFTLKYGQTNRTFKVELEFTHAG
ncbi:MAG: histidine kinase [Deferribacteres bacterium]|nr:histidine kinase [Deferribacteres bacterium]